MIDGAALKADAATVNPVEGACVFCDRRRNLNAAAAKRHREKKMKIMAGLKEALAQTGDT